MWSVGQSHVPLTRCMHTALPHPTPPALTTHVQTSHPSHMCKHSHPSHITCSHISPLTVTCTTYTLTIHSYPSLPPLLHCTPPSTEEQWGGASSSVWRLSTRGPLRLSSSLKQPTFPSLSDWRTSLRYATWQW